MMTEGLADRGFDNLILPPMVLLLLMRLLPLGIEPLLLRTGSAAALLALVVIASSWSTLSGGALLGAALYGYGCATLADPRFVLPPVALFVCHIVTMRRHHLEERFDHRLDAVLSQLIATYPWVLSVTFHALPSSVALAGTAFAMAAQLSFSDASTRIEMESRRPRPTVSAMKGWLIAATPGLLWLLPFGTLDGIAVTAALATTWLATLLLERVYPRFVMNPTRLWVVKGGLALVASLPAFWFHS